MAILALTIDEVGIDLLQQLDGLKHFALDGKDVYLHEDHRWVLPLVADAQEKGLLPRPVRVILFDRHTDAAEPGPLSSSTDIEGVIQCCQKELSIHDDDWIVAGIKLGLLADVFIFGVNDRMGELPKQVGEFAIFGRFEMPAKVGEIGVRGREVLDWNSTPILLDLDLDCFAYPYRDQVLAWSDQIFEDEFGPSKSKFQQFVERAGLITICREAGCCGGEKNAEDIWARVQSHLFDNRLLEPEQMLCADLESLNSHKQK